MIKHVSRIWLVGTVILIVFIFYGYFQITNLLIFPFQQLAMMLRHSSLSTGLGNIIAWAVLIFVSGLPLIWMFFYKKDNKLEKGLLILLSIVIFVTLYSFINPNHLIFTMNQFGGSAQIINFALAALVISILFTYIVVKIIRLAQMSHTKILIRMIQWFLAFVGLLLIVSIFTSFLNEMLVSFQSIDNEIILNQTNYTENEFISIVFIVIRFVSAALPNILSLFIILGVIEVLDFIHLDLYSFNSIQKVNRLVNLCTTSLIVILISNLVVNILFLLFAKVLSNVTFSSHFSISSILFVLAILLFSRLLIENQRLKEENEQFV